MLVKSISFINSPFYGNITFDFCDSNGIPYNTVILAGENGAGKSTLLNIIFNFCQNPLPTYETDEIRTFVFQITEEEKRIIITQCGIDQTVIGDIGYELTIKVDYSILNSWNALKPSINRSDGKTPLEFNGGYFSHDIIRKMFKGIFSDVEVNYTPNQINSTSSLEIDVLQQPTIKSSPNLATEITQLLIDIESLDSCDFTQWAIQNKDKYVHEGIVDKRMSRFKKAFNFMFPSKRFKRVANTSSGKKVLFEEYGREISISDFSSGEKQIVFRGSFLLKDKLATQGAIVLIDEPEISLHPKWQLKIMDFYKKLFQDGEGTQTSQLFIATHSPFVIHNENIKKDKIVILGKNELGVFIQEEPKFYGWSSEEAIIQAFNIRLDFESDKVIVFVEGPTDEKYINTAIKLFGRTDLPVKVQWIGSKEKGVGCKFTGDTALVQTKNYLLSNHNLYNNKVILLFDSDTNAKAEDIESANLYIRRSPLNEENTLFKKGIENLLTLPVDFRKGNFYDEKTTIDDYGAVTTSQVLNKTKLCNWICEELSVEDQKGYLSKLETSIIEMIEDTMKIKTSI